MYVESPIKTPRTHPCILVAQEVAVALRVGLWLRPVTAGHRTTRQVGRLPVYGGRVPGARAPLGRPVAGALLLMLPDAEEVDLALLDGRLGRAARFAVIALE